MPCVVARPIAPEFAVSPAMHTHVAAMNKGTSGTMRERWYTVTSSLYFGGKLGTDQESTRGFSFVFVCMTRITRAFVACVPLLAVLFLLITSARLLVSDILAHGRSLDTRESAVRLFPGNVSYILALADLRRQSDLDAREQLV